MKEMKVRITFEEPVLGTRPADPEIHSRFVASKAPDAKTMAEEVADLGATEVDERSKTIFPKLEDGTPFMYTYMLEGFFKEAARTLKKVPGTKTSKATAYIKTIDNLVFVEGPLKERRRIMPLFMPMELDLTATDNQRPAAGIHAPGRARGACPQRGGARGHLLRVHDHAPARLRRGAGARVAGLRPLEGHGPVAKFWSGQV